MFYRLRRWARKERDKILFSIDARKLRESLEQIGVNRGGVVCVHSTMTGLGHFAGGPGMIVETIKDAVGRSGAVMMPTYSTGGAAVDFIDSGAVFDVRRTPSQVGLLTEVFRRSEGIRRSLHPTNAVAGWGDAAWDFLRDHEKSLTAYGNETPYGRMAASDDACILMLGTHVQSLLHHIQERIEFPNLFLPETRSAKVIDAKGNERTLETKPMRARIPYFVAIPSPTSQEPSWAILHDFCLIFERNRERLLHAANYDLSGYPRLYRRRQELEEQGILRSTSLGRGNVGLLRAKEFVEYVEPEFRQMISRFRSYYDIGRIAALRLRYL